MATPGRYSQPIQDLAGNAYPAAKVEVLEYGSSVHADLFSDDELSVPLVLGPSNELVATQDNGAPGLSTAGMATFYADAELRYQLKVTIASVEQPLVTIEPAPTGAAVAAVAGSSGVVSVNGQIGAVTLPTDGSAGTASLRTLGTGGAQAASGTDSRLSDTRVPTDLSVTTAKIAAGAVTAAKVAADVATQAELDAAISGLSGTYDTIATAVTLTGAKSFAPGGLNGYFRPYELVASNPPGIKGPTIQRSAAGGATGLSFYTGSVFNWSLGQDLNPGGGAAYAAGEAGPNMGDFVLANQLNPDLTTSRDICRIREGAFMAVGNAAMPVNDTRLRLVSNGTFSTSEVASLRVLLGLEIGDPVSAITHLIKTNVNGGAFGVLRRGWLSVGATSARAPMHVFNPGAPSSTEGDALTIELAGSNDPGYLQWAQGALGTGTLDWRIGRTADGNVDLQIVRPDTTVTSALAPGAQAMLFKRNGDVYVNRSLIAKADAVGTIPLIARGFLAHTNAIFSVQDSTGATLSRFDAAGRLVINRAAAAVATLDVVALAIGEVPLIVSGFSSGHTANLINARKTPTGAAVFFVDTDGAAGFNTSAAYGNATISAQLHASLAYPIVVLRRVASQTSDFITFWDESSAVLSRVGAGGRWITKVATAPALGVLVDGELAFSTDAAGNLIITSRVAGALKTATVTVA